MCNTYVLLFFNSKYQLYYSPQAFWNFFYNNFHFFHSPFGKIYIYFICHLHVSHVRPIITMVMPITNSQPDIGSNKTSNIPRPNPIKQTPIVFLNKYSIYFYFSHLLLYIIFSFFLLVTFYVVYSV